MILLNGQSLTAAYMVPAVSMSLQIKEREATATLTPESTDGIGIGSWMQDDREPGAGTVWRVRSIQQGSATITTTVQLEHIIATLKDRILFGEIKPGTITGNPSDTTCTARQAVEYILAQQSDWTLGQFDYEGVSNPYKFDGDTLFEALETVTNSLTDAYWTYDMTTYPFTLNIIQHSATVDSELRAGRNLKTISRTVDKSGMFTRFYPIGKNDLHISGNYVEKNVSLYGVISKVETDQSLDTTAELTAWANERLNAHAQPNVSITVEGLELSRATGEPMDQLTIGRVCRVPLPEFNTTIQERIVEISYTDKIKQPEVVKITLANSRQDVTRIIADALKRSGKGGRTSAKKGKEDHAWFEDTNDHVSMTAIGVIGVDAAGNPNWTRLSEFIADGEGLHAKVETQMQDVTNRVTTLEIDETGLRTEVTNKETALYSAITQTEERVNVKVGTKARTWIQDTDPRSSGNTPQAGDIWVESTHQGTWDGAEGFDWIHDEDYDWTQVQGAKIWGWQNDKWELISDQQQVVTMTDVDETAEHIVQQAIRAFVNDEGNLSVYRAELAIQGDQIRSEVNEVTGQIYSTITQTASQIDLSVKKNNRVYTGMTEPTGSADHPLIDGDIWLESSFQRIWSDMEELDAWIDDENFDWSDLKGSKIHVYDAEKGEFREVLDEQVLAQDTDIIETDSKISLIARSVKQVDEKTDVFRAELKIEADRITSTMNQRNAQLDSRITQTAAQIRTEVNDRANQLSSSITQTASQIRAEVVDTANGLSSTITQTAGAIRSEVADAKTQLNSSITQTAGAIRSEVTNSVNNLQSQITQTANTVSVVVSGSGNSAKIKPAAIQAAIDSATGSSKINLSADHIILDGDAITSALSSENLSVQQMYVHGEAEFYEGITTNSLESDYSVLGDAECDNLSINTQKTLTIPSGATLKCYGYNVSWKSRTINTYTLGNTHRFTWKDAGGSEGYVNGQIIIGSSSSTIYYLGR